MVEPLTEVRGTFTDKGTHYMVLCKACGEVPAVAVPATAVQAGLVQRRHLAEHLSAIADEITQACR